MFELPEGKELLSQWGITEPLTGVGALALGYPDGDAPQPKDELLFRFFLEAMRDPAELRKAFVESKNVDAFRESLIGEQLDYLTAEYRRLIESEYSEVILDANAIKSGAKDVFPDSQG